MTAAAPPTPLILVGGFLGAGKTSLLRAAALRLQARRRPVGLITNDQAPDLVDTAILTETGAPVREVAGSCFCCDFGAFLDAATSLAALAPDTVVMAEPVGSCTDLRATIIHPLRRYHRERFAPRPLTALIDPERLEAILTERGGFDDDTTYIMRTQLEEADVIAVSKADRLAESDRRDLLERLRPLAAERPIEFLSARSGEGVDAWLDAMLEAKPKSGPVAEVDYDRYARGEAALGWLNAVIRMRHVARGGRNPNWTHLAATLLGDVQAACRGRDAPIGHVKSVTDTEGGHVTASAVSLSALPEAVATGEPRGSDATVTINARVQARPEELEAIVRAAIGRSALEHEVVTMHVLSPGRPQPTHREAVVDGGESEARRL